MCGLAKFLRVEEAGLWTLGWRPHTFGLMREGKQGMEHCQPMSMMGECGR